MKTAPAFGILRTRLGNMHVCGTCDYQWPAVTGYYWRPVRLKWGAGMSSRWFSWHGWEMGTDRFWRPMFGWTFHLGRLKVIFGPDWRTPPPQARRACPNCDATAWEPPT